MTEGEEAGEVGRGVEAARTGWGWNEGRMGMICKGGGGVNRGGGG